jgi:hypothetical protein
LVHVVERDYRLDPGLRFRYQGDEIRKLAKETSSVRGLDVIQGAKGPAEPAERGMPVWCGVRAGTVWQGTIDPSRSAHFRRYGLC